jgi:hypothetical protein
VKEEIKERLSEKADVDKTISHSNKSRPADSSSCGIEASVEHLEEIFYINVRFLQRLKQRERTLPTNTSSIQSSRLRIALELKPQTKRK